MGDLDDLIGNVNKSAMDIGVGATAITAAVSAFIIQDVPRAGIADHLEGTMYYALDPKLIKERFDASRIVTRKALLAGPLRLFRVFAVLSVVAMVAMAVADATGYRFLVASDFGVLGRSLTVFIGLSLLVALGAKFMHGSHSGVWGQTLSEKELDEAPRPQGFGRGFLGGQMLDHLSSYKWSGCLYTLFACSGLLVVSAGFLSQGRHAFGLAVLAMSIIAMLHMQITLLGSWQWKTMDVNTVMPPKHRLDPRYLPAVQESTVAYAFSQAAPWLIQAVYWPVMVFTLVGAYFPQTYQSDLSVHHLSVALGAMLGFPAMLLLLVFRWHARTIAQGDFGDWKMPYSAWNVVASKASAAQLSRYASLCRRGYRKAFWTAAALSFALCAINPMFGFFVVPALIPYLIGDQVVDHLTEQEMERGRAYLHARFARSLLSFLVLLGASVLSGFYLWHHHDAALLLSSGLLGLGNRANPIHEFGPLFAAAALYSGLVLQWSVMRRDARKLSLSRPQPEALAAS